MEEYETITTYNSKIKDLANESFTLGERMSNEKLVIKASCEDKEEEDLAETMSLLAKNFKKTLKRFNKKLYSGRNKPGAFDKRTNKGWKKSKFGGSNSGGNQQSRSKGIQCRECEGFGHIQVECPNYVKNQSKSYYTTLSDDEFDDEEGSDNKVESVVGKKYVYVCVDDFSRYTWVEFIKEKSYTFDVFKQLAIQIKREKEVSIVAIGSDHGREFENSRFQDFCSTEGIKHECSAPITPQQNDIVEHKNRTLPEMARVMSQAKQIPIKFWAEALNTPKQKFDVKSDEAIFLGYSRNRSALRVYNKRTQVIMESTNVKVVDRETSIPEEEDTTPLTVLEINEN
ncbi:hypothetical protein LIER_35845 [Lithospermum erythrorhizon]|uniref:Integrase catalytic domain-containing protein n=1 Tax=Lithospermum erythrorhizon TaxID=34254 RepID=A0AAV3NYD7_LITER